MCYLLQISAILLREQSMEIDSMTQQRTPAMPLHKPPPIPLGCPDMEDATYESLDDVKPRVNTAPPPPPHTARNSTGHEVLYHILEGALEDSSLQYKHPTLARFIVMLQ